MSNSLPYFCLERWQSENETKVKYNLSESGVEISWDELKELGIETRLTDLGYGWTKGNPKLREEIAKWLNHKPEGVLVTVGGAEANFLATLITVNEGDKVLYDMPNYLQIWGLLRFRKARVIEVWRRWDLPIEEYVNLIRRERPKAIFVTNPNNPTGRVSKEFREIVEEASKVGATLVFDEVYRGLEFDGILTPSVLEVASEYGAKAISTGSLSKSFGVPGLRIGWLASDEETVNKAWALKDYTTISPPRISEEIAIQILEKKEEVLKIARGRVKRNYEKLKSLASDLLDFVESQASAFVFAKVKGFEDTMKLAKKLLEKSILINPGECFGVKGYLRIGLGGRDVDYTPFVDELRKLTSR